MYIIRDMEDEDKAFIYSTWLRGLYYGDSWFAECERTSFFANYHKVIEILLPRSIVKIACLSDNHDVVLGYVVFSGPTIHWIFVKKAFRKMGIARAMVPERTITTVTHLTKLGRIIKPSNWVFDPFKI